ncbi:signal transducer and activator of transcription C-like isoform X1 [Nasonia vitripennis]|uniref:DUF4806 domain-containing protein n=1 Tax=Nasonia vitripennis TaxID=7425 RepID=A0A7M7T803_NASVI|nr:signal transducer and activator of transcription C-like isoform X1 [Nasonia vitripennis]
MERKQQRTYGSCARSKPNILTGSKRHGNPSTQKQESINKENMTQLTNKKAKYAQQSITQNSQQVPRSHNSGNQGSGGLNPHTGTPSIESHFSLGEQQANGNSVQTFIDNLKNQGSSESNPVTESPLTASHSFSGKQPTSIHYVKKIYSNSMQLLTSGFIAKDGGYDTSNQKVLPLCPKKSVPRNSKPVSTVTNNILSNATNALPVVPPPTTFVQEDLHTPYNTGKSSVTKKSKPASAVTTTISNQNQTNALPVVPAPTNFVQDDLYSSNDIGKPIDIEKVPIFVENLDDGELSAVEPGLLDGDEDDFLEKYPAFIVPKPKEGEDAASDLEQGGGSVQDEDLEQHEDEYQEQEEPAEEIVHTENNVQQNNAQEQDEQDPELHEQEAIQQQQETAAHQSPHRDQVADNDDNRQQEPNRQRRRNHDRLLQLEQLHHEQHVCCAPCRMILLHVLEGIEYLRSRADIGHQDIGRNNGNFRIEEPVFDRLQMLPIDDRNALLEFDQHLVDPAHRQTRIQFEQKISSIDGTDFKKLVPAILEEIMTDNLAENCTWLIQKTNKSVLSHYNFPKIIIRVIKDKLNAPEDQIIKRMQKWLQKTGDRKRYKEQQARRQAQLENNNERNLFNRVL